MASIQYVVNATDAASGVFAKIAASADGLDKQLEDLGKRVADPEVSLEDSKFTLGMIRAAERLDKLSAMVADPSVEVDTARAQTEILRINAMLDRLDAKRVNVTVDVDRRGGLFGRLAGGIGGLFGGAGGAAGAGAQAGGGALAATGQYGQAAAIMAAITAAITLGPALIPLGIGALAGGGAAGGALMLGSAAQKRLQALQSSLRTATGGRRRNIQAQITELRRQSGGELGVFGAFQGLGETAQRMFSGALESRGPVPGARGGLGGVTGAAGPSFLTSLQGILRQVGGFIKSIGPGLGDLFRASVPFLKLFVHFLEQAAKTLLPVFVNLLKSMTPYLPLISKGLMAIVGGFAGFLKALGPSGMQASAKIFVVFAQILAGVMVGIGHTINWLAEHIPTWAHNIAAWFDRLRRMFADWGHNIAVWFDRFRHDAAHWWDMLFQNTVGRVRRGWDDITREFDTWRHNTAVWFDRIRHDIAAVWDTIWNNTVGRVKRGISDVIGWFKGLPGRAVNALQGLGTSLWNFGSMALTKLWNGMKNVFGSVWSWFKSLPSKLLHAIGINSPPDWAIQAGRHIMGGLLQGITSRKNELLNAFAAAGTAGGGRVGQSAAAAMRYAQSLFPRYGWSMALWPSLRALWMGESGWNSRARNPSSGAYGIPQALPANKMASAGPDWLTNAATQVRWGLSYIAAVYGNPGAAYNMWLSRSPHWYGTGLTGGIFTRPTLIGVGDRGPERVDVTPAGSRAGGNTYNITVHVPVSANKADTGRQVVEAIREYEKRSGAGWRR